MPEMIQPNDWFWFELMTTDQDAAAKFYSDVVGWTVTEFTPPGAPSKYLILNAGGIGVAGVANLPPEMPAHVPPHWGGYIHAKDVDALAEKIKTNGGHVRREPADIPAVGRFAVVADPEGGIFMIMSPLPQGNPMPMHKTGTDVPGAVSWCELHSNNENNLDFYLNTFGWHKSGDPMDMGPNGSYTMFTTNDLPMTGGSMRKMAGSPEEKLPTYWLYYFYVDALDAAIERTKSGGGKIFMGPHEVPGGTWVAIGHDPQGGTFALHSRQR